MNAIRTFTSPEPAIAAYVDRKRREIALIASGLQAPQTLPDVTQPRDIIDLKFRLAALCKADAITANWHNTETRWSGSRCRSGSWRFGYDYQRADLTVQGPDDYGLDHLFPRRHTIYTSAGMAAIAAVLIAARKIHGPCRVITHDEGYPETRELADLLFPAPAPSAATIRIIDTTIEDRVDLESVQDAALVVVDTSCLMRSSGRLRRMVRRLGAAGVPTVLVRSHMKLDSLGVEYGRLGSIAFLEPGPLLDVVREAVRLTGTAPVPNHFPPYAPGEVFSALSRSRVAQMIRNGRVVAARLRAGDSRGLLTFPHGLYLVLLSPSLESEEAARSAAGELAKAIDSSGIPARHAGSFGFDFFGCEWFRHTPTGRFGVRVSMPDLPRPLAEEAARVIARWFARQNGRSLSDSISGKAAA